MRPTLIRGLAAGFIAAFVLAITFLVVDVVHGYPLRTPAYMSGLVFSFTTVLPASGRLALFTALHFALFGVVGVVIARLFARPSWLVAIFLAVLLVGLLVLVTRMLGVDVVAELAWLWLVLANLLASFALVGYLRWRPGSSAPHS